MAIFNFFKKKAASLVAYNHYKGDKIELPDTSFIESVDVPDAQVKRLYKHYLDVLQYPIEDFNEGIAFLKKYVAINTEENRRNFTNFDLDKIVKDNENIIGERIYGCKNVHYPTLVSTGKGSKCEIQNIRYRKGDKVDKKIYLDLQSIALFSKAIDPELDVENIGTLNKYFYHTLRSVFYHETAHYDQKGLVELMDKIDRLHYTQNKRLHLIQARDLIIEVLHLESEAWKRAIAINYRDNSGTDRVRELKKMIMASQVKDFVQSIMCRKSVTFYGSHTFEVKVEQSLLGKINPIPELEKKYEYMLSKRHTEDDLEDNPKLIDSVDSYLESFKDIKQYSLNKFLDNKILRKFKDVKDMEYENFLKVSYTDKRPDNFIVFDLETTGLKKEYSEIIELGAIKFRNNKPVETFHTFVKPKKKITAEITSINGITNEMVKNSPSIDEVIPKFLDFIEDDILVAHNASFDMGFILNYLYNNNYKKIRNKVIDTLSISRQKVRIFDSKNRKNLKLKNYKLENLKSRLGLEKLGSHNAIDDCKVCAFLYMRIVESEDDYCYVD